MFKQFSGIIWGCLLVLGLSACAHHAEQRRFSAEGQPSPVFSGEYRGGLFRQGTVTYGDKLNTIFSGKFNEAGFPLRGELRQSYQDAEGGRLQLLLTGDFSLDPEENELGFAGGFVILDAEQRILASAEVSHWAAAYGELHPFQAPQRMTMAGENTYTQYRRDISPAGAGHAFVKIRRPLSGPFEVDLRYQAGVPRGIVKISTTSSEGRQYVVERQYFNFQIAGEPVHYFYYEPGSFTEVDILGDCKIMPNLTAPQALLSVYAYDCDKAVFYALSEDFPASVLAIAAADLDNSGAFHRFTLYHHGVVSQIEISVDALYEGQWLRHGDVRQLHYGDLRFYARYLLGTPIGIGIQVDDEGPKYRRFVQSGAEAEILPSAELYDRINGRYEWQVTRLNKHFSAVLGSSIVSADALATLKEALLADLSENKAIAQDGQVPGLSELWQSWQRQSRARIITWQRHSTGEQEKTPASMQLKLKADIDKWLAQSQKLLLGEAERRCELNGQSFNSDVWQCENRPDARLVEVCVSHLSKSACTKMAGEFAASAAQ
ncbi:hypothetical protein [Zhongshania sp.]|uniref:hypothetical protein n=1 Tax=Zhongshania sp. TaxID=1971902 RepID=UPI002A7F4681|nr:hypothetical protein [Zhongshania sp.]